MLFEDLSPCRPAEGRREVVKDSKQNIRYVGFECGPGGSRVLEFSFDTPKQKETSIMFEFAAIFFRGENRILLQEAAGICSAKLKAVLGDGAYIAPRCLITGDDIVRFRQLGSPRQRARTHA